ncbi:MAG: family transposase [Firmicutes bacterium]|nr:family transposase [Bacillota bacterium]
MLGWNAAHGSMTYHSFLLREFYPKGMEFRDRNRRETCNTLQLINNRQRECLGWKTAYESFIEKLLHLV